MTGQGPAAISNRGEMHLDAVSPLLPPRIAFPEAVGSKEPVLRIRRQGTALPLQIPPQNSEPCMSVPLLVPWFERLSRTLVPPFGEFDVDICVDARNAPQNTAHPGDFEIALRILVIETALGMARQHEGITNGAAVKFVIAFTPSDIDKFVCHWWRRGFIDPARMLLRDVPRPVRDWIAGVTYFAINGTFPLPSAHQRLEFERQLRVLRTRLPRESSEISECRR